MRANISVALMVDWLRCACMVVRKQGTAAPATRGTEQDLQPFFLHYTTWERESKRDRQAVSLILC